MKLTSAKLKQMIRELMLEAYEMTPEDEEGLKPFQIEKGGMMAQTAKKNPEWERVMVTNMRRALGINSILKNKRKTERVFRIFTGQKTTKE